MKKKFGNSSPPQDLDSPVKLLFGLYQCLHHLSFLTGDANTGKGRIFRRKIEELDRFFIPALPTWNPLFGKKCHETNEKWRQEQIGNLTEHYQWCIEALKGSISAYNLTRSALLNHLNQAKKWAKQHFKRKFQNQTFDKVDQMVQNFIFRETTAKGPVPSSSSQIRAEPKKVAEPEPVVPSTPSRKRGRRSSITETSPTQTQTPKRSKNTSYAEKVTSPTFRPNAKTQKSSPAVTKFPSLKPDQRGARIHTVWQIPKLAKDILVLGDSNLARISFVNKIYNAQIISYSGLKLDLLLKLLQNFKFGPKSSNPGVQPSQVIFSVGLNDRDLSDSTNGVNLKKVFNEAKRQFPNSKIGFCLIPFDSNLPVKQRETLDNLNAAIQELCEKENLNCIPRVPRNKFSTTLKDPIHWTENCANAIIEHTLAHLN